MKTSTTGGKTARTLAWTFALLLAAAASGFAVAAGPDRVGEPAPALVVRELDGSEFDLAAEHGRLVVLNFWATWCTPCRAEMPMLAAFARAYAARGVIVLGVSVDDRHDRKDVVKVARNLGIRAALLEEATANGFAPPKILPITYVIGADGRIAARLPPVEGGLTEQALAAAVDPLLAQPAPVAPPPS